MVQALCVLTYSDSRTLWREREHALVLPNAGHSTNRLIAGNGRRVHPVKRRSLYCSVA